MISIWYHIVIGGLIVGRNKETHEKSIISLNLEFLSQLPTLFSQTRNIFSDKVNVDQSNMVLYLKLNIAVKHPFLGLPISEKRNLGPV